jgi:Fe-S cluster assembly protein SufD
MANQTTYPTMAETAETSTYRDHFQQLESQMDVLSDSFYQERRTSAIEAFERAGFPTRKNEEWKYTSVGELTRNPLHPTSGSLFDQKAGISAEAAAFLPDWKANRLVFINGRFSAASSSIIDQGAFTLGSLADAIQSNGEQVAAWFDALHNNTWSAFAQLNSALYVDGAWIHLQPKAVVEHPILILDLADQLTEQEVIFPRHLVVAETGSSARIVHLQGLSAQDNARYRSFSVMEAFLERDARVVVDSLQDGGETYQNIHALDVRQDRESHFTSRNFSLGGKLIRNDLRVRFAGEHSECDLQGFYLAQQEDLVDNHLLIDHAVPNCLSNQLYKGIADDEGTGIFNGKIFVRPNAQKTNAYQSNKNLLLSERATINTKPQLEIFADDVKCSHGATSGQIDTESLFYLMARGIPADKARTLLLHAFAGEVASHLPKDDFSVYLDERITHKIHQTKPSVA